MTETAGPPAADAPGRGRKAGRTAGEQGRGQGLTVERVHTTPGVHPYDEVTWECSGDM
jgi:ribonucleoside-diphosphate reductase alpha chain